MTTIYPLIIYGLWEKTPDYFEVMYFAFDVTREWAENIIAEQGYKTDKARPYEVTKDEFEELIDDTVNLNEEFCLI